MDYCSQDGSIYYRHNWEGAAAGSKHHGAAAVSVMFGLVGGSVWLWLWAGYGYGYGRVGPMPLHAG